MKSGPAVFILTSLMLAIVLPVSVGLLHPIVFAAFVVFPVFLICLTVSILKDKESLTDRTFDEYFYEDSDYRRNTGN